MIEIHLRSFGRTYSARATIDGKIYKVTAVVGAANKLAKMLRVKGIPDQPIQLINPSGNPSLSYPSLYKWATFNYLKERDKLGEEQMRKRLQVEGTSNGSANSTL